MVPKSNQNIISKSNPKKRVLFVITQSELGGAQRFLAQLINSLDPNRFELAIAGGSDGNKEIAAILPKDITYITARHLRRNPNIFNDIASLFELKNIIKDFKPDTLFLNSSKAGFNGSWALRLAQGKLPKIKVIYRIGGWTFNDPWPWWKRLGYRWLEQISANWKDIIIVNNKHDYDQAIKFDITPQDKVVLIYNGIDPYKLEFLEKEEAKIRLYEKLPSNQKYASFLNSTLTIGTIANFYKTKGLEYLIEAFKLLEAHNSRFDLSNRGSSILQAKSGLLPTASIRSFMRRRVTYHLVIIGDGPEREKLILNIKHSGLENKIFLTGKVSDAYKYLKAFDIFVLPSVKEGFPWALLEAMSAQLPVIATSVGANPEIIENEKNGFLVPPANPQALANAIMQLASDESLRQEMGIQAHQTVIHKYDPQKMIEQIKILL